MRQNLIDHDTDMDIKRVFIDTHGQSVIGFAVSYLLNFALFQCQINDFSMEHSILYEEWLHFHQSNKLRFITVFGHAKKQ